MKDQSAISCSRCRREAKNAQRLPRGWKRLDKEVWCNSCWGDRYVLRAITMPIASPLDCDWKQLDEDLREAWIETTRASNWMMTQYYVRDIQRNGQEKMPAMERIYLYPEARTLFPSLASQSVASLEQTIQRKYRALRYKLIWTNAISLPNHRYPVPLPVHNQSWRAEWEGETPTVVVRIGPRQRQLRLKGGPRYRRQRTAFALLAEGRAVRGELALYRKRVDGKQAVMVKMVAWFPRPARSDRLGGTLYVRTAGDAMLVALNEKDERLWIYHGDHVRRWSAEHARRLRRWADDTKAEQRPIPSFSERRRRAAEKYRNRMSSACHEIAAQLANYAKRRRLATVQFKDETHSFCQQFPWSRLRDLLEEKLTYHGIKFELASDEVKAESPEALADGTSQ